MLPEQVEQLTFAQYAALMDAANNKLRFVDFQFGWLRSIVCNLMREKDSKAYKPADFMVMAEEAEQKRKNEMSPMEQMNHFKNFVVPIVNSRAQILADQEKRRG